MTSKQKVKKIPKTIYFDPVVLAALERWGEPESRKVSQEIDQMAKQRLRLEGDMEAIQMAEAGKQRLKKQQSPESGASS